MGYFELLQQISKDISWDYYKINPGNYSLLALIDKEEQIELFIAEFWRRGEKSQVFDSAKNLCSEKDITISNIRWTHMLCTFFLGVALYCKNDKIRGSIDGYMAKRRLDNNEFFFIWFLACFFHDIFSRIEEKNEESLTIVDNYLTGVPRLYKNGTLHCYNENRLDKGHRNDHGIYAGGLLYCFLMRNRRMQLKGMGCGHDFVNVTKQYQLASSIVSCHNIWFCRESDFIAQEYQQNSLARLILKDKDGIPQYSVKLRQYPLLFLFCLVDTIETYKEFENLECSNYVYFDIEDNCISIRCEHECGTSRQYLKKVEELKNWLTPTEKIDNTVKIIL